MPHFSNSTLEIALYSAAALAVLFIGYRIGRMFGALRASKEIARKEDELFTAQKGFKQLYEQELAGLMRDAGDGAGHDQADVGATSFERDHELTVLARERETLAQIERALAHIDDGSYGVCDSCGNPVGKNRLMAVPHATLCMSCKQREERR